MSKFRRFAIVFIILELIIALWGNKYVTENIKETASGEYKVDISRISARIEAGESPENIDLDEYKTIVRVVEFDSDKQCRYEYAVKEINGVLYQFEYENNANIHSMRIAINVVFGIVIMATMILLWYLDRKIISPFSRMNNMTTELAKGNLAIPIRQEKSRYFGKFLWGMDMLREKLEDDKRRELALIKEKKTLILSLSHDIKTPLSAIDLYTKALESNLYDNEEDKCAAIKGIEKNVGEIKRYVSEIVNASRDDFLSLNVNNEEVYLSDIIETVTDYYDGKMKQFRTEFKVDVVDNCLIYGDGDRIVEVMQNTIENAIKYGDGRRICISFDEEENYKLINISNTGCNIANEELPHIFDSFYRGSNSDKEEGSGLGLYICKELMHMMDGEIFAKISGEIFCVTIVLMKIV